MNIPVSTIIDIDIRASKEEKPIFEAVTSYLQRLARVEKISFSEQNAPVAKQVASAVVGNSKIIIPLAGLINIDEEIARQNKKLEKLLNEKKSLDGRINNPKFVSNAPKELIETTKARIEEIEAQANTINELINNLRG